MEPILEQAEQAGSRCVLRRAKILIAEDNPEARIFLRAILKAFGYDVIEAGDGAEAIRQAFLAHPALILMDLMLPRVDGVAAAREISASRETSDIPIVAISAYCGLSSGMTREAMEAGCVECIAKPIEISVLQNTVEKWLSGWPAVQ